MASLKVTPSAVANIGYNGFDMSHTLKFTSTTGELLPVYYDILYPGDKVKCNIELKTRTMPLESAAMAKITEHVEWFFVPMEQIYSVFGSWYYGIDDVHSSLFQNSQIEDDLPFISPSGLLSLVGSIIDSNFALDMYNKFSSLRLLEHLGVPFELLYERYNRENPASVPSFCPLFLCAYQKIFSDFYRLSDRQRISPDAWSLDKYHSFPQMDNNLDDDMFMMRYRPKRKDFFTNLFVSPLAVPGQQSMLQSGQGKSIFESFSQWLNATTFNPSRPDGSPSLIHPTQVVPLGTVYSDLKNSVSPTSIRTSFALQKLLEVTRRAGKHYDAQTLAHFGVKVPVQISGQVFYLGKQSSMIRIGDVIATASTDDSPLGRVGGKGYGYTEGRDVTFTANCHGILMAIYSADLEDTYNSPLQFDRLNCCVSRADWRYPEYDNLGFQPLFRYQLYGSASDSSSQYSDIIGWQYRYSELKTKYNKVLGSLARTLKYWTPISDMSASILRYFYVSPNALDNIMLVPYNFEDLIAQDIPTAWDSDPLIHELYLDVKKSSKMSTYGLEQL